MSWHFRIEKKKKIPSNEQKCINHNFLFVSQQPNRDNKRSNPRKSNKNIKIPEQKKTKLSIGRRRSRNRAGMFSHGTKTPQRPSSVTKTLVLGGLPGHSPRPPRFPVKHSPPANPSVTSRGWTKRPHCYDELAERALVTHAVCENKTLRERKRPRRRRRQCV